MFNSITSSIHGHIDSPIFATCPFTFTNHLSIYSSAFLRLHIHACDRYF
ncbi:MAG: hypothetical protein Q8S84_07975 [bacterium]|nr:hypothetical protein [bacterium]MDP3381375.1 hypothetical protein [bacterium]